MSALKLVTRYTENSFKMFSEPSDEKTEKEKEVGIAEEENENEKEDEIVVEENENVENIAKETSDDDSANESIVEKR